MKKYNDRLQRGIRFARYILTAAVIGMLYASQGMHGAGMNRINRDCSASSSFRFFTAMSAIIPGAGEQVYQTEPDKEQQLKPDSTVSLIDDSAPLRLFIDQNYPNPFRVSTSIRYGLPRDSYVTVTIHTMLGNPVKTLLSETQKAGVYTLDITVPDLMPGIYFYRLQSEYGVVTRRLTISR